MAQEHIMNEAWYKAFSDRLGSSQLKHALARLDRLEKIERGAKLWKELLERGQRDTVESEMHRLLG